VDGAIFPVWKIFSRVVPPPGRQTSDLAFVLSAIPAGNAIGPCSRCPSNASCRRRRKLPPAPFEAEW